MEWISIAKNKVLMYYETCLLCAFIKHVIKQNYYVMQHESNNEMKATDG